MQKEKAMKIRVLVIHPVLIANLVAIIFILQHRFFYVYQDLRTNAIYSVPYSQTRAISDTTPR
jgi:hypothetical protein